MTRTRFLPMLLALLALLSLPPPAAPGLRPPPLH